MIKIYYLLNLAYEWLIGLYFLAAPVNIGLGLYRLLVTIDCIILMLGFSYLCMGSRVDFFLILSIFAAMFELGHAMDIFLGF